MHIFSVIIPHHNIPQLLQRCLDSIPDVPDVQVIVVDDNSSADKVDFDHFPGLERKYTECVFDKQGGGAGHARNVGMQHADGKWLVFADADDFFTPDAFSILNRYKDEPYNIILFKANSVDSDNYTQSDRHIVLNEAIDLALNGSISLREAILAKPVPWCKMVRTAYIAEHNIRFDETMASNDLMFVAKATCWADVKSLSLSSDIIYTVTTRKGSLMDNLKKEPDNYLCRLEVLIRYHKFVKEWPELEKEPIILALARSRHFGFKTIFKALVLVLRNKALFYGFGNFLRIVNRHTLKL